MQTWKSLVTLTTLAALAMGSSIAEAGIVSEVEPNDTPATAQNLDGNFTLTFDANVANSATIPHVTVELDDLFSQDFFSFTLTSAATVNVDVDDVGPIGIDTDYFVDLYDDVTLTTSVGSDDDSTNDAGDNGGFIGGDSNPNFTTGVLPAGTYFLSLGNFGDSGDNGLGTSGGSIHISSDGAEVVPEPASVALLGLGVFGLAGVVIRRRRRAAAASAN